MVGYLTRQRSVGRSTCARPKHYAIVPCNWFTASPARGRNVGPDQGRLSQPWAGSILHGLLIDPARRVGRARTIAGGLSVPVQLNADHVTACAKKQDDDCDNHDRCHRGGVQLSHLYSSVSGKPTRGIRLDCAAYGKSRASHWFQLARCDPCDGRALLIRRRFAALILQARFFVRLFRREVQAPISDVGN
jgi:hypothetical protein